MINSFPLTPREQYVIAYRLFRELKRKTNVIAAMDVIHRQFSHEVEAAVWETYLSSSIIPGDFYRWTNPRRHFDFMDGLHAWRWAS